MAELNDAFRTARIREPFGILWDGRHFEQDLKIQLLGASPQSPVALLYMDLKGMKNVNDTHGHDAGDLVLRAYFNALSSGLADKADAYRLGGDEVGVILSNASKADAVGIVNKVCLLLMGERLRYRDSDLPKVSVAAGMIVTSNPSDSVRDLREKVDKQMYKAKESTKGKPSRPSSLAIDGDYEMHEFQLGQAH